MTPEENGIMRDAFYFLRDHINPPPLGTEECAAFWNQAAKDLAKQVPILEARVEELNHEIWNKELMCDQLDQEISMRQNTIRF